MRLGRPGEDHRGQGMVEFALILPLLALLMVMALDFGRVFFGWVALENATRIAADYAAKNYDAWTSPDDVNKQQARDRYDELIATDTGAINCTLSAPPVPQFSDPLSGAVADPPDTGDHATVKLECQMALLTPLASSVLGGGVNMSAEADFVAHKPETIKLPENAVPPPPPGCDTGEARIRDLVGMTMQTAWTAWDTDFDTANFTPRLVLTGPGNNKNKIVSAQNPAADTCANTTTGTMTVTIP